MQYKCFMFIDIYMFAFLNLLDMFLHSTLQYQTLQVHVFSDWQKRNVWIQNILDQYYAEELI